MPAHVYWVSGLWESTAQHSVKWMEHAGPGGEAITVAVLQYTPHT